MVIQMPGKDNLPDSALIRRFHAYNIGIPKTGTTSIAALFGAYRSAHEFMFPETVEQIVAVNNGLISDEAFREYIIYRDRKGCLEMDSASFNHYYLDILVESFPNAKFIFTIRDCYSWLNSFLNMLLRWRAFDKNPPKWHLEYSRFIFGELNFDIFSSRPNCINKLPELLDIFLRFWRDSNRYILERLPKERSLVVRVNQISESIDKIADFVGIPGNSLISEVRHANQASGTFNLLKSMNSDVLEERCAFYCSDLMSRIFPGYSLDNFHEVHTVRTVGQAETQLDTDGINTWPRFLTQ